MKVFWLRLLNNDFTYDSSNDVWESDVLDLYDNSVYTNYSITRSQYGSDLMGNRVWTGLDPNQAGNASETGKIKNGRWLDTSGRIDVISYQVENAPTEIELSLYVSDLSDDSDFRNEWASFGPIQTNNTFDAIDVNRNAKFVVSNIDSLPNDIEFYIRAEIGKPVMAPYYRMTKEVLNRYPEWMDVREFNNQPDGATATPDSVGGQVVNAIAGEWLDDQRIQMKQAEYQQFIDTVDLDQVAWVYETGISDQLILWSITGDGTELTRAADWAEFVEAPDTSDVCLIDFDQNSVFTRQKYDNFKINDVTEPQSSYHVWNFVDEIGMLVDLERHYLEDNKTYRWRILDVYRNHHGGGRENLQNALRRELNLWHSNSISPDSQTGFPDTDANGSKVAIPELLDIQDILDDRNPDPQDQGNPRYFFDAQGTPTKKFTNLVRKLSWEYPATWGRFQWDRAIWDPARADFEGFSTTPDSYDGSQPEADFLQHGVGDMDDLHLVSPTAYVGSQEFTAELVARGFERQTATKYLPVQVDMEIYGEGLREEFDNPVKTVWHSIEIDTPDGLYVYSFQMSAKNDVNAVNAVATVDSYDRLDIWDDVSAAVATRPDINFVEKNTQTLYNETGQIPVSDINSIKLIQGQLSAGSYGFQEVSDDFESWFSSDPSTVLTYDSGPVELTMNGSYLTNTMLPTVIFKSKLVNSLGDQPWPTSSFTEQITVNDRPDHNSSESVDLGLPDSFDWDQSVTNKNILVQLTIARRSDENDPNSNPVYGALAQDEDGSYSFIDSSHIDINGNTNWTSDGILALPENTSTLTVSVNSGNNYPRTVNNWVAKKWTSSTTYDGVVDKVGPWHNGQPQDEVGANTRWITIDDLTRDDFGIPHNDGYVVTRLRADVTSQQTGQGAVVWLDSQIVESDADFRENVSYPDNAIREIDNNGTYQFDPFVVNARLVQTPNDNWNPFMRSGFFFDGEQEFYIFADEQKETFSDSPMYLSSLAHQGAPVIVKATSGNFDKDDGYLTEVSFPDVNYDLTLKNTETVQGTGGKSLFLAYSNVYDAVVEDAANTGTQLSVDVDTTSDNAIELTNDTSVDKNYIVRYYVYGTYIVDRFYWDDVSEAYMTKVTVDSKAAGDINEYTVTYEGSSTNAFTPAEVTLNPMKTITNEGYIFIGREENTLETLSVELTPSKVLADGEDYLQLSIQCLDVDGNPKPDQQLTLSSTFGTFSSNNVTVDRDGFVMALLTADNSTDTLYGEITVEAAGGLSETVSFDIEPDLTLVPRIYASPTAHQVEANGENTVTIYGRALENEHDIASGVTINWRRARHLKYLWAGNPQDSGSVMTDSDGRFTVGPFTVADVTDPGYWFLAVEATIGGETVGDVVFWFEYPVRTFSYEAITNMPIRGFEFKNSPGTIHPFANEAAFPYGYDEDDPYRPPRDTVVRWLPPSWFPLPKYQQYQLGLFADNDNVIADSEEVEADSDAVLADSGAAISYTTYVNNLRPYIQNV